MNNTTVKTDTKKPNRRSFKTSWHDVRSYKKHGDTQAAKGVRWVKAITGVVAAALAMTATLLIPTTGAGGWPLVVILVAAGLRGLLLVMELSPARMYCALGLAFAAVLCIAVGGFFYPEDIFYAVNWVAVFGGLILILGAALADALEMADKNRSAEKGSDDGLSTEKEVVSAPDHTEERVSGSSA